VSLPQQSRRQLRHPEELQNKFPDGVQMAQLQKTEADFLDHTRCRVRILKDEMNCTALRLSLVLASEIS
jgi:hypothetical protein